MAPPAKKHKSDAPSATPTIPGGDDLEDNFALDDDDFAGSPPAADAFSDNEGEYDNLDEDSRPPIAAIAAAAGGEEEETTTTGKNGKTKVPNAKKRPADDPESIAAKKKKGAVAKEKKRGKAAEAAKEWEAKEFDDTARMPVEGVADRLSEKQRKALPEVSGLELDEMRITESMIHDTSSIEARKSLLEFMKEALPVPCNTLAKMPKATGSPRIIVVSGAALRVADLCREMKGFKTKTKDGLIDVGKLFAKHFKLAEHVEYMSKTHVGVAVGTPNRVEKLLSEDSLHLTYLSHLILDVSHLDAKKRSIVDLPEARGDLFRLLGNQKVMERLREGKMKIVLF